MRKKCLTCNHQFEVEEDQWILQNKPCPSCKIYYCDKPKSEALLLSMQLEMTPENKDVVLAKMSPIIWNYACSLLKKKYRRVFQPGMSIEDKGWEVAGEIIEEYLQNPNYRVKDSFAGIINLKILWVLFRKQEAQVGHIRERREIFIPEVKQSNFNSIVELVKPYEISGWEAKIPNKFNPKHLTEKGYKVVLIQSIEGMSIDMVSEESRENNLLYSDSTEIREIDERLDKKELIKTIDSIIMSNRTNGLVFLKKILAIRIYMIKGESASDKFFELYGRVGKEGFITTLRQIKTELIKRMKQ